MLIKCTKKLLDQLHIHPAASADEEPLFSWHANLITVNRRKTVVLVNDKSRYVIVLLGLRAKDFKMLDAHIIQAIRETFREECIKDEIIEQFIYRSGVITYTKTRDRKHVDRMNKACALVPAFEDTKLEGSINQSAISIRISRLLVGAGPNRYIRPGEELYKDLEALAGKPVFGCKAAVLRVTLDFGKHHVWRKVVVPWQITFARPPEDVGGEHGYEELLKIIADEKHPEHERMLAWGSSQGYKDFDLARVNRALRFGYRM